MPVNPGATVDFNPVVDECETFGYSFDYVCGGTTFESRFNWKTLVLNDNSGAGTTVFAPITGRLIEVAAGEAVTGPTGPTGDFSGFGGHYLVSSSDLSTITPSGELTVTDADGAASAQQRIFFNKTDALSRGLSASLDELTALDGDGNGKTALINIISKGDPSKFASFYIVNGDDGPFVTGNVMGFSLEYVNDSLTDMSDLGDSFVSFHPLAGIIGPTGEDGSAGPEGLTLTNGEPNTLVFVSDPTVGVGNPADLESVSARSIQIASDGVPEIYRVRENVEVVVSSAAHPSVDAAISGGSEESTFVRLQQAANNDISGITLSNFGTGDYVSIALIQPSGGTFSFNSVFATTIGGVNKGSDVKYATGLTYPVGKDSGDVDVFYVYCIGYDGGTNEYLVNHQRYHDTI